MNQDDLHRLCLLWQSRLRLLDWRVSPKFVHRYELAKDLAVAEIYPQLSGKLARMLVLLPEEVADPQDNETELSIVHELLHLHFEALQVEREFSPLEEMALEQSIEAIAEALVDAYSEAS